MQLDLSQIARNLEFNQSGLWTSRTASLISYPEEGNQSCFAVEEASFWFRHRNACILNAVRSFPPSGTFFDVGGGNGYVSRALQEDGFDVVLVEPGATGAQNARHRGIRNVVQSTLEDAAFQPQTLPAVGLFDVVEHIEDDLAFLREINRLLTPDGRVYIAVPAFQWLWSHEDESAHHWRRYTIASLSKVLQQSGYVVEYSTYFFGFLILPIFFFRVLPYRLGLRRAVDAHLASRSDHVPNRHVNEILNKLTSRELSKISAGKRLKRGGSCLVVARKVQ